ncbi:glucan biosynthesis protein G [Hyphomonas sp.]|uniref:glucan biosynthesis protein G n=1 Tax=Hyphomonas sp. TaxID=87 RepID=UPI0032EEC76C
MKLTQRPYFIPAAALGAAAAAFLAGVIIVVTGSSGTTEATVASVTSDADIIVADVEPAPVPVAPVIEPLDSVADYTPEALETGDAAPDAVTPDTATPSRAPFAFDQVINKAQALSEHAFQESRPVPAAAAAFDYDQYRRLEFKRESAEWTDDTSIPFRVHYDPRGYLFNEEVKLNIIDKGVSTPKAWAEADFNFFDLPLSEDDKKALGYAGFHVTAPLNSSGKFDDLISFKGASFFRVLSAGTVYGASARGMAISTASPAGEEFPSFREFWLVKPEPGAKSMTVYALLNGISTTGAFQFVITPGSTTNVDVEAVFFPRRKLTEVGVAPITSMYYFSPHSLNRGNRDYRVAVHDSEGLMMELHNGEWVWRPLANPNQLEISSFATQPPLGFGLVQRKRDFEAYDDLEANYELRPNVWIAPKDGWGPGNLTLVEIPTTNEYNDNIVVSWRPADAWEAGKPVRLSYEMIWSLPQPVVAPVAKVTATKVGISPATKRPMFIIDFDSDNSELLRDALPQVSTSAGTIIAPVVQPNPKTGGVRLSFELDTKDAGLCELRALLTKADHSVSETWLYRWRS